MGLVTFFEFVGHARLGADLIVVRDTEVVQIKERHLQLSGNSLRRELKSSVVDFLGQDHWLSEFF
jgi:hypothetical protein